MPGSGRWSLGRARRNTETAPPVSLATVLRRPLLTSVASIFVLSAAIVITATTLLVFVRPVGARYERAVFEVQAVHAAMVDQETGVRGFLIARDTAFLQPYSAGRTAFATALATLRIEVADDARLTSSVDVLAAASTKWQETWAQPLLQNQPRVDDQPALDRLLKQGKTLFDAYRTTEERTLILLERARAANRRTGFLVNTGGATLGFVASCVLLFFVTRSSRAMRVMVLPPVGDIRATVASLADGRLDARAAVRGPTEMRDIAVDINGLGEVLDRNNAARLKEETKLRNAHAARDDAIAAGHAKEEFLAMMSHEIRTPLNAVIGLTDLMLTTELNQQQRQNLAIINRSGDTLLTLINNILDYSKIAAGELNLERVRFDLIDLVEGVAEILSHDASTHHLHLRTAISAGIPRYLTGDAARIRQILLNLVSNAVKFTDSGQVEIGASLSQIPHNPITSSPIAGSPIAGSTDPDHTNPAPDSLLTLTVRDTGIGIPAHIADQLFEPFTQADASTTRTHGGTGLGLAISRRIARAMAGDITLVSTPGAGSTFTLVVPLSVSNPDGVMQTGLGTDQEFLPLLGLRILAVDDNATNQAILTAQVERNGGVCVTVRTAAQALAALAPDHHDFDAALLDFNPPDMKVVELARRVQALHQPPLPLVLLTNTTLSRDVSAVFAVTLRKPATSQNLVDALQSAMGHAALTIGAGADVVAIPPQGLRVLIAEDVPINQDLMVQFVTHLGHHADVVENGADAVAAVRDTHYDVVFMDAQMPSMDGVEATRIIRTLPIVQPRIVAVTAGAFANDQDTFLAAGADQFCAKPIRLNDIAQALNPLRHANAGPAASVDIVTPEDRSPEHKDDVLDSRTIALVYQLGPAANKFLGDFLASLIPAVDQITTNDASGQPITQLAHILTGTSGFFGVTHVAKISGSLQDATKTPEQRADLITQLRHEADRAHTALDALLHH